MIKFTPPFGALCVSTLVSDTSLELLYCFRDVEDDPHHYQAICKMSEFVVRPCDSGYVFTNLDVARVDGTIPAPVVEHRHLCTWQELCAIKQLWQRPSGLSGSFLYFEVWLRNALQNDEIPEEVKERLKKLI